jgi:DNA replication and repair protein RecF
LRLDRLWINNFRNYDSQDFSFHPRFNFIEGLNGQGKTNLLEAIYYLAVSRSFRASQDNVLLNREKQYFFLKGHLIKEHSSNFIEMGCQPPQKLKIKVNGTEIKRAIYIHQHPVVVFSPDDLLLIKEGPSGRRRFLDLEGSRLKPLYFRKLREYHRVLQHRNRLLRESRNRVLAAGLIEPWDQSLVTLGSELIRQRLSLLHELEKVAQPFYRQLASSAETLSLAYISTVAAMVDPADIDRVFSFRLKEQRGIERIRGYTMLGPHLDDFAVLIDGHDARQYGSQGQQRSAVLALKMGEVSLFQRSTQEIPVILLDDVFSEFDLERRNQLLNFLLEREGQSFLTAAAPVDKFSREITGQSKIFLIHKGKITGERAGKGH